MASWESVYEEVIPDINAKGRLTLQHLTGSVSDGMEIVMSGLDVSSAEKFSVVVRNKSGQAFNLLPRASNASGAAANLWTPASGAEWADIGTAFATADGASTPRTWDVSNFKFISLVGSAAAAVRSGLFVDVGYKTL